MALTPTRALASKRNPNRNRLGKRKPPARGPRPASFASNRNRNLDTIDIFDASHPRPRPRPALRVYPRKGGGGKGGGSSSNKGGKGNKGSSSKPPPASRKGAPSSFTNSKSAQPFTLTGFSSGSGGGKGNGKTATATAYGDGGGRRFVIGGSGAKFGGREAGGGTRNDIYGSRRFGSGYPYGGYGTYVNQRPFPFVFYPVPVSHGYYGGDEYLDDDSRPGGPLVSAVIQPSYNVSSVTYRIVGDNSSVLTVFDALVANCSVSPTYAGSGLSPISHFSPSPTTYPRPEQIIQYYRASSFALSLDGYNNTAALLSSMPASNSSSSSLSPSQLAPDTPLPLNLNTTFLACLNSTIAASVPLVDPDPPRGGLSTGAKVGIAIGSVFGFFFLILLWVWLRGKWVVWREKRLEHEGFRKRMQLFFASRVGYREVKSGGEGEAQAVKA